MCMKAFPVVLSYLSEFEFLLVFDRLGNELFCPPATVAGGFLNLSATQ